MKTFDHFGDIVQYLESTQDNPTAFNDLKGDHWHSISTKEFIYDLKRLTYGLIALGMKRGDKVGILSTPSAHWMMSDLAIMLAGGISVPLFSKISDDNFIYEVAQASIRFLFVGGGEQWRKFIRHQSLFEAAIGINDTQENSGVMSFHEILRKGEVLWQQDPLLFDKLLSELKGDAVATIVYTSGSTGAPKGAELTHKNLIHLIMQDVFSWKPNEKYLSILPLAHIFARQIIYIMIPWGVSVYFLKEPAKFARICKELKPELMIVVPRLLEKIYDKMVAGVEKRGKLVKKIGRWAVKLASLPKQNILQRLLYHPIANLLVYKHLRAQLGGHWRIILCGGAKLNPELYTFFLRIGFPVYEGWGLTEGSTCCVNRPGDVKVGTVGRPLPGIQVKIGFNDEILVNGPTVMKGYYRYPKATKETIDEEGWLHTGDKGKFDEEGRLSIIGRIKEQFKLSTGEYVVPNKIEQILVHSSSLIDQAMVIGEGKPFAAALIFPDLEELRAFKKEKGMENISDADFLLTKALKNEIEEALVKTNERINRFERVSSYRIIIEPLSVETGELTPTFKIKRSVVREKLQDIIERIYSEEKND